MNTRTLRTIVLVAVAALAASACGPVGAAPGSAGGVGQGPKDGTETTTLRLVTTDGAVHVNDFAIASATFVEAIQRISGGRLQVDITTRYGDDGLNFDDAAMVEAMKRGEFDVAWPATRGLADAGIDGLGVIDAPMTITNYEAAKAITQGPVADQLLARLEGTGLVGLGLAVHSLRRPFAADAPLLSLDDWAGQPFRYISSPVQEATVRAFGATPATPEGNWQDAVKRGTLRGTELDVAQYHQGGEGALAPFVTSNVVLWPKIQVLTVTERRFDSLSAEQQGWLRAAADEATQAALDFAFDETPLARELCDQGVRFVRASDGQLSDLRAAAQPVIDDLASDDVSGPLLAAIQKIAAEHPGIDEPDVPATCRTLESKPASPTPSLPDTPAAIPDGVYRATITLDAVTNAGMSNEDGHTGIWTLTVRDGRFQITCGPLEEPERDCGNNTDFGAVLEQGPLKGSGDRAFFAVEDPRFPPYDFRWKLDGDQLTFFEPGVPGGPWFLAPWTRIDD
ncbi:MAG TPA: TRAP transporter substrate-binding protein DctP [Candidatus Limnocylindrales bacterium]|nr:TRAP transporter substrate-binding protein DctP [Candidatus Limnocylindrales bacterium]